MTDITQWEASDELNDVPAFYVYVLVFREGGLYVGHTNSLSVRLIEHAFGDAEGTRGKAFKLGAALTFPTREMAIAAEARLWKMERQDGKALANALYRVSNMVGFVHVDTDTLRKAAGLESNGDGHV